ncbi:MAG: potassium channel family protein [Actinobacteria bacterium]|nr:potassium channel family protein [Actinomycetota bacterium]
MLIILVLIYFGLWLIFGFIYRWRANVSKGNEFSFQDNIKIKQNIRVFKKKYNIKVPDYTIKDLINRGEVEKETGFVFESFENKESYHYIVNYGKESKREFYNDSSSADSIGLVWATYYMEKFISEGATHFKIDPLDGSKSIGKGKYLKHKLSLFGSDIHHARIIQTKEDIKKLKFIKKYTVYLPFSEKPSQFASQISEFSKQYHIENTDYQPMSTFTISMSYSINLLDGDIDKLKEILKGEYEYPIVDFLYFSAVTITTLGYGDILPNSSLIRFFVMLETFFGIVTVGWLISLLFAKT